MRKLIVLLTAASLAFSFASCNNCKGNKCSHPNCNCGDTCRGDSCQCGKVIINEPVVEVKSSNLYLDNSSSMKGYTEDMTYINVITQLWKAYPNTQVLKCADAYNPIDEGQGSVVEQLKKLAYSSSSLLQDDLAQIIGRVNDNNIAFFVTDGILSGEADKINPKKGGDRKWTIKNAANLKLQVQSIFEQAKAKGIGLSVYQFISNFKGVYYCYTNIDNVNINCPRYFYVFVIGKPHVLLDFKARFADTEFFRPKNQLHLIDPMPLESEIYSKDAPAGKYNLKNINNKAEDSGQMLIAVKDAPFINSYAKDQLPKLASKFQVSAGGKKMDCNVSYDPSNNSFTFFVRPQLYGASFDVQVTVPYELPGWVKLSSQFDQNKGDSYMMTANQRDERTFMLDYLIDGIRQGLVGNGGNLYESQKTFKREEN